VPSPSIAAVAGLWQRDLLYEPRATLVDSAQRDGGRVLWAQAPCGAFVDVRHVRAEGFGVRGFAGAAEVSAAADDGSFTLLWHRHVDTQPASCPTGIDTAPCRVVGGDLGPAARPVLVEDGDGYLEVWRRVAAWDPATDRCEAAVKPVAPASGAAWPAIRITVGGVTFTASASAVACAGPTFAHDSAASPPVEQ
jgi:hypothetical protein